MAAKKLTKGWNTVVKTEQFFSGNRIWVMQTFGDGAIYVYVLSHQLQRETRCDGHPVFYGAIESSLTGNRALILKNFNVTEADVKMVRS